MAAAAVALNERWLLWLRNSLAASMAATMAIAVAAATVMVAANIRF